MRARDSGQAAVELAVLAPVLALAVLVFAQLALAFRAELAAERAAGRAQAAAVLGRPVLAAARTGAPPGTRALLRDGVLRARRPQRAAPSASAARAGAARAGRSRRGRL